MAWAEYYPTLKLLHGGLVALSLSLFAVRGYWMWTESPRLKQRWVRILPHGIDSGLLLAALGMVQSIGWAHPWLWAKLAGLVGYVVFGSLALRRAPTLRMRRACLVLALLSAGYIVAVALSKSSSLGL